jgi:hypothetical protein
MSMWPQGNARYVLSLERLASYAGLTDLGGAR